jgi:hypothetical protein
VQVFAHVPDVSIRLLQLRDAFSIGDALAAAQHKSGNTNRKPISVDKKIRRAGNSIRTYEANQRIGPVRSFREIIVS